MAPVHDPMTVAFGIRRPWPRKTAGGNFGSRWSFRGCFWQIAGQRYYWPSMITVWHVEPDGHDSGEVCKRYRRTQDQDGKWTTTYLRGWRWHVHHWRIQVIPLQELRRRLLTRCAWCHGRSTKVDPVNFASSDVRRGKWWQGDRGVFHRVCSSVHRAHLLCLCDVPDVGRAGYGQCGRCGRYRAYGQDPRRLAQAAVYAAVRPGERPTAAQVAEHLAHHERIKAQDVEVSRG